MQRTSRPIASRSPDRELWVDFTLQMQPDRVAAQVALILVRCDGGRTYSNSASAAKAQLTPREIAYPLNHSASLTSKPDPMVALKSFLLQTYTPGRKLAASSNEALTCKVGSLYASLAFEPLCFERRDHPSQGSTVPSTPHIPTSKPAKAPCERNL